MKVKRDWVTCLLVLPSLPLVAGVLLGIPSILFWGEGNWVYLLAGAACSCLIAAMFQFLRTLSRFHMIRHALKLETKKCCGGRDRTYRMWAVDGETPLYCGEIVCRKCEEQVSLLETDFKRSKV